jgi:hypothetical protein
VAGQAWPTRIDEQLADGVTADDVQDWVQSASLLHSNGDRHVVQPTRSGPR